MSETTVQQLDLKAISERYFAAWAERDPDAIVALHTDDTWFWSHLGGEPAVGREAVRGTFAEIFEQFPDFTWETYRVLYGEDHWVLDWALISGDLRFDCLDVVVVSPDGLVARKDTFIDMRTAAGSDGHGAAMTTAVTRTDQLPLVTALPAEHLFDMHVDLQPAQPIPTPVGTRLTFITDRRRHRRAEAARRVASRWGRLAHRRQ